MAQRKWKVQPQLLTSPSSLAISLGVKYLFNASISRRPINLVSGWVPGTINSVGSVPKAWGDKGLGWGGAGGSGGYHGTTLASLAYPFTLFGYAGTSATFNSGALMGYSLTGTGCCALYYNSNGVNINYAQVVADSASGLTFIGSTTNNLVNKARFIVGVFRSTTNYEVYVDGVSTGTGSVAGPTLTSSFEIGVGYFDTRASGAQSIGVEARLMMCGAALGEMPLSIQREIVSNPWVLFAPPKHRIFVSLPASGTTLSPTEGQIIFTGFAPSLTATLAPTSGSVVFGGNVPSLTLAYAPSSGAVIISGNVPSFSTVLFPTTGAVVISGNAPSLQLSLVPTTGQVIIGGNAPTLGPTGGGSVVIFYDGVSHADGVTVHQGLQRPTVGLADAGSGTYTVTKTGSPSDLKPASVSHETYLIDGVLP